MIGLRLDHRDRRILALAVPALGSLAIEPLYLIVDTAIVGHLGKTPLGGLAVASSVLNVAFWIFHFLLEGVTTQVAVRIGAGDTHGASHVVARTLTVAVLMGLAVSVLLAVGANPIAGLFGGTGAVRDAAATYLRISAVAPPFIFVSLVATGYLRGIEVIARCERLVIHHAAGDALLRRELQPGCARPVADHRNHPRRPPLLGTCRDDRAHVRATARDQDDDALHVGGGSVAPPRILR